MFAWDVLNMALPRTVLFPLDLLTNFLGAFEADWLSDWERALATKLSFLEPELIGGLSSAFLLRGSVFWTLVIILSSEKFFGKSSMLLTSSPISISSSGHYNLPASLIKYIIGLNCSFFPPFSFCANSRAFVMHVWQYECPQLLGINLGTLRLWSKNVWHI